VKNAAAVALGKLGGKKGGAARAIALTKAAVADRQSCCCEALEKRLKTLVVLNLRAGIKS
jgi:hypothetical protein